MTNILPAQLLESPPTYQTSLGIRSGEDTLATIQRPDLLDVYFRDFRDLQQVAAT